MISVLIIEDEPPAARRLERLVRTNLGTDVEDTAGGVDTVRFLAQAIEKLSHRAYDIICLDLNLAGEDGFRTLRHAATHSAVIVVSAHLERAVEGFEHDVVDFVPKPVSAARFSIALERAKQSLKKDAITRLAVRRPGGVEFIPIGDIICISGAGDYVEIQTTDGRAHLDDRSLAQLEQLLHSTLLRVHRSHLVNSTFVRKLIKSSKQNVVELEGGVQVPVARRAVSKVTAALSKLSDSSVSPNQ